MNIVTECCAHLVVDELSQEFDGRLGSNLVLFRHVDVVDEHLVDKLIIFTPIKRKADQFFGRKGLALFYFNLLKIKICLVGVKGKKEIRKTILRRLFCWNG